MLEILFPRRVSAQSVPRRFLSYMPNIAEKFFKSNQLFPLRGPPLAQFFEVLAQLTSKFYVAIHRIAIKPQSNCYNAQQ
ncbi:MAG TPA: hypothetical protein VLC98_06735 [Phnomibacter sp.]|nr:hypothetical protein [Phnomibacter sp.]